MKILEKTYKAYLKFQVSGKKKNKNNDESICQDVVWYSKEKIKKSKENINKPELFMEQFLT